MGLTVVKKREATVPKQILVTLGTKASLSVSTGILWVELPQAGEGRGSRVQQDLQTRRYTEDFQ